MASLFRSLSQRFRRSKRYRHPGGGAGGGGGTIAGTSEYQQGFDRPEMDPRKQCQCKVMLLDGSDMNVVVSKNANGQELYDQIFYTLDLEEKDYFGLQFMDHYHVQHWLDPVKRISKQVPIGPPYTFRFRVKFYSSEPNNLREELTRYQFFLQLKQDIQSGRLECPKDIAIELAALALQSELGDYNPAEHTPALISEFRFHPEQDEEMEIAILEKFTTCRGQSPATAEMNYLNKAKWIELYGVDMHTVEGKDGNLYRLGLTPSGMLVFDGNQKIGLFLWEKIQKLDFKNRKITLVVEEDADQASGHVQLHTFVFNLSSHKACKHLWKCAIEHHTFFRLKYHRPRVAKASQLFRLGSTFRYRGRTEYENVHKDGGRLSRRQSATFERRPSQRYGPRQSLVNRRIQIRNDFKQQVSASVGFPISTDLIVSSEKSRDSDNKHKLLPNGNGFASADTAKQIVNGYANSSRTSTPVNKVPAVQNMVPEGQISGFKELDRSPSATRRPFNAGKGSLSSPPTSLPLTNGTPKPELFDVSLNMKHEASSQWSGISAGTTPVSHVTTIAINSNGTQIRTPTSPSRIPRHNGTPFSHSPPSINNSGIAIASQQQQQPYIARNFPENGSGSKSSGPSTPGSAVSSPPPIHQTTSPSKSSIGSPSVVRSSFSSPAQAPLNQTFTISPGKPLQNSTLISESSAAIHASTASSGVGGCQSLIHPPSSTNGQNPISAVPASRIPTVPTSTAVTRTDTFTITDRKPFGQAEYCIRSCEKSSSSMVSGSHQLAESHSRIPHLRTVKSGGTAVAKTGTVPPPGSFTSMTQVSERNLEAVAGVAGEKSQRSRLPVRSGRNGHSSSSVTISETPGSRTPSCDEKISQSRIPVMASSTHRPHPQIQSVGQMEKSAALSYFPAAMRTDLASTNSRVITDL